MEEIITGIFLSTVVGFRYLILPISAVGFIKNQLFCVDWLVYIGWYL